MINIQEKIDILKYQMGANAEKRKTYIEKVRDLYEEQRNSFDKFVLWRKLQDKIAFYNDWLALHEKHKAEPNVENDNHFEVVKNNIKEIQMEVVTIAKTLDIPIEELINTVE